jgi:hypothetical protein
MKPVPRPLAGNTLYDRIDLMPMGAADREIAKSRLRSADRLVRIAFDDLAAIRSHTAHVARRVRRALAPAPAPQH